MEVPKPKATQRLHCTRQNVTQDEEGMQTMRQLGLNMVFLIKSIQLGIKAFGSLKIKESMTETHHIRQ